MRAPKKIMMFEEAQSAGASSLFTDYNDIGNLLYFWAAEPTRVWQDAGKTTQAGDGDVVHVIDEQVNGAARDHIAISGSDRGTYRASEANGQGAVDFSSAGHYEATLIAALGGSARTVVIVAKADDATARDIFDPSEGGGAGGSYRITTELGLRVNSGSRLWGNDDLSTTAYEAIMITSPASGNTNNSNAYKNNNTALTATSTTAQALASTGTNSDLGDSTASGSDPRFTGMIALVAVYDKVLSAGEITTVMDATTAHFGI